jgi:hypothetical protein
MELKPFQLKFQQHVVRGKEGHTRATDFCILTARRTCVTRYGLRLEKITNVEECVWVCEYFTVVVACALCFPYLERALPCVTHTIETAMKRANGTSLQQEFRWYNFEQRRGSCVLSCDFFLILIFPSCRRGIRSLSISHTRALAHS